MAAAEFASAVRACRAELRAHGFTLGSSGGYRPGPVPIQARLGRARWQLGDISHDWELHFGGPTATWVRGGLDDVVFSYYQADQQHGGDFYAVDSAEGVERFLDDFHRRTLPTIECATSPEDLIGLLTRREIAPLGGFGKGNRTNQAAFAGAILRIAAAYGIREAYAGAVIDLLRPELGESPERRSAAIELAQREGLELS